MAEDPQAQKSKAFFASPVVCCDAFTRDLRSGDLSTDGHRRALRDPPFEILRHQRERPGKLVTLEELRRRRWPAAMFVDLEHGLNAAVKRLRSVPGDSADAPRFIETIPRRGYRFVATVPPVGAPAASPSEIPTGTVDVASPESPQAPAPVAPAVGRP
jgi:DNA-binding winged helix-turn-helix (wHTH) protein